MNYVYRGIVMAFDKLMGSYRDGSVYRDAFGAAAASPVGVYRDGCIYRGAAAAVDALIGRYAEGVIYRGKGTDLDKIVGIYKQGYIYRGWFGNVTHQSLEHVVGRYDGPDDGAAAAALLLALV